MSVILHLQVTIAHDLVSCSKTKATSALVEKASSVTPTELSVSFGIKLESRDLTSTDLWG